MEHKVPGWAAEITRRRKMKAEKTRVLEMIAKDMEDDAKNFDGQPFNGRTVAEYFGHQGAAIAALANIVKLILKEEGKDDS